ncbi:MAG: hypothetical protein AAGJ87_15950, partial [Pseudomonadota bacterium]
LCAKRGVIGVEFSRPFRFRAKLLAQGFDVEDCDSQIIAITTGANRDTQAFRDALAARGVCGSVFLPPATPKNGSLIRFTVSTNLSADEIDRAVDACVAARAATSVPAPALQKAS